MLEDPPALVAADAERGAGDDVPSQLVLHASRARHTHLAWHHQHAQVGGSGQLLHMSPEMNYTHYLINSLALFSSFHAKVAIRVN